MDDLIIRNANIVDGSGCEAYNADVLVDRGKIKDIGKFEDTEALEKIDAAGRCLTPGFIDIHRHADLKALGGEFGPAELYQGITTCISGNCGMSAAPCAPGREEELYKYLEPCLGKRPENVRFPYFSDYVRHLKGDKLPLNMGAYVGSGAVRIAVKGFDQSPMSRMDMDKAKAYVAEAMESGAMGLSMGIMYAPECSYSMEELAQIASEAGRYGGILVTHIRGEGDSLADSVAEVIEVAKRAEVSLNISHFKAAGRNNWGRNLDRAIGLIENARSHGQDVTCDVYPYEAGSTMLLTIIPPSFLSDGVEKALSRFDDKKERDRLRLELSRQHKDWDNLLLSLGWRSIVISSVNREENKCFIGKSVEEIARITCRDEVDCVCDLLQSEEGKVGMVIFSMSIDDVKKVMGLSYSMIISDSIYPPSGNPHPRLYGAFPRVISKFVLGSGTLTLQEAVKKMTSMPASRLGLRDKGLLKIGYAADMLLFSPENVMDTATYEDSARLAKGMDYVFIEGKAAIRDGSLTGSNMGKFITKMPVK
jgi:N-acyl-D-aspartate/D-glutamate deacylase